MTYETIDYFLRNNLGDEDYGNYSEALDAAIFEAVTRERERCVQLATDAIAFNGGSIQMEAHVRRAIRGDA